MAVGTRDLNRLEEHGGAVISKEHLATYITGIVATVIVVVGLISMLQRPSEAKEAQARDPLATLVQAPITTTVHKESSTPVTPEELTFHQKLMGRAQAERSASLARAAAEFAHPSPTPSSKDLVKALPAGVVAGVDARDVARNAQHDPLVAAVIPKAQSQSTKQAQPGMEGRFTLQVISYESRREAALLAEGLRTRGHRAYVIRANEAEHGERWRVRIGPFGTFRDAQAYRKIFEQTEDMNTYVVRKGSS